jgi:hypothetical protein
MLLTAAASPAVAETMVPLMVKAGSNLMSLANRYCHDRESWRRIAEVNNLRAPYIIREDRTLLIPAGLLLSENVNVTVGGVRGQASLSLPDTAPRPVATGDQASPGATVETGPDGYVLLIFPDQRFIRVDAGSSLHVDLALRLADGSVQIQTTLKRGGSLNNIKPGTPGNDGFILRTPTALTGVRGTEYRLKVDGDSSQVETLRGEVYAAAQGATRTVPVGQGVIVRQRQAPGPTRPLPAPPHAFVAADIYKSQPLSFRLPDQPDASMRLTVSRDEQGLQVVERRLGKAGENLFVTLPEDGRYFVSLTAINGEGFESLPTPPKAFVLRTSPAPPILTIPKDARFFSPSASLSWARVKEAASYRVMVAKDASFAQPLHEVMVSAPSWKTPDLPYGPYYVRIQSVAADGFQSNWSENAVFTIAERLKFDNDKLAAGKPLHLRWHRAQEGAVYDLQVAAKPDFSQPLVAVNNLPQPEYTLEKPLEPGVYYLRVRSHMPGDPASLWGPAEEITIAAPMGASAGVVLATLLLCIIL